MLIRIQDLVMFSLWLKVAVSYRPRELYYDYYYYVTKLEKEEIDPLSYTSTLPPKVNGTTFDMPSAKETPDYRIEEKPEFRYYHWIFYEMERPYRISPAAIQLSLWQSYAYADKPLNYGCGCTTVYKRFTLLATCAVLTLRHVLTTATSTELILKNKRHYLNITSANYDVVCISETWLLPGIFDAELFYMRHLEDILGVWYDTDIPYRYNSSMYATPARIHYHPKYLRPEMVNRSHPFPVTYDLALWTMTTSLYTIHRLNFLTSHPTGQAYLCGRATNWHGYTQLSPTLDNLDLSVIIGYQFIRAFKRKPSIWAKYAVRTKDYLHPCPKTEWGWFHCINTKWAKLGLDQGANLHRTSQNHKNNEDGLLGMNVLSMKLRSIKMVSYFINLDSHPVLDFLYDAYLNSFKHEYLDFRFYDQKGPVKVKDPETIDWRFLHGEEHYVKYPPNY